MKITQDVRDYAKAQGLDSPEEALEAGLQAQAETFRAQGGEMYHKA